MLEAIFGKRWKAALEERGRSGIIHYHEGPAEVQFYWELGGGDTIAIITGPPKAHWDENYPWARGRRPEVYARVAKEIARQRAGGRRLEIRPDTDSIYLVHA